MNVTYRFKSKLLRLRIWFSDTWDLTARRIGTMGLIWRIRDSKCSMSASESKSHYKSQILKSQIQAWKNTFNKHTMKTELYWV
jgi:hypothetical protein